MSQGVKGTAQHGTVSMYALGCRKPCCREAWNAYHRDLRARNRPSGYTGAVPAGRTS